MSPKNLGLDRREIKEKEIPATIALTREELLKRLNERVRKTQELIAWSDEVGARARATTRDIESEINLCHRRENRQSQ